MSARKDMEALFRRLQAQGCTVERSGRSGHVTVTLPDGGRYNCPATPSDYRSPRNVLRDLRRRGFDLNALEAQPRQRVATPPAPKSPPIPGGASQASASVDGMSNTQNTAPPELKVDADGYRRIMHVIAQHPDDPFTTAEVADWLGVDREARITSTLLFGLSGLVVSPLRVGPLRATCSPDIAKFNDGGAFYRIERNRYVYDVGARWGVDANGNPFLANAAMDHEPNARVRTMLNAKKSKLQGHQTTPEAPAPEAPEAPAPEVAAPEVADVARVVLPDTLRVLSQRDDRIVLEAIDGTIYVVTGTVTVV